jgi:NADH dehydrogenase [ubiquinone] 1 alpha subcomplex assembly factor 7
MNELKTILRNAIKKNGTMPFEQFMETCLYHPQQGYYVTLDPLTDFATSPEISQLFGEMIALWCVDVWMKMGEPSTFALLECGPGRGTLMADVLRTVNVSPTFMAAAKPVLLEKSLFLREKQREKLTGHAVTWINGLDDLEKIPTIMFCNELFDAFPVQRFMKNEKGWARQGVTIKGDGFDYALLNVDKKQQHLFSHSVFTDAPLHSITERSDSANDWMAQFLSHIAQHGGAGIAIDYGYDGPMLMDSVQAIHNKKMSPVLDHVGKTDISANVDFTPFREAAATHGLKTLAMTTQRDFLMNCGVLQRAIMLKRNASVDQQKSVDESLHRLIAAERMGDMFKVFCVVQANLPTPIGFKA